MKTGKDSLLYKIGQWATVTILMVLILVFVVGALKLIEWMWSL